MPTYMDVHEGLQLPQEAIAEIARGAAAGEQDAFGVRQIELFHNAGGTVYCVLEAPDEAAVRAHHQALGVDCGRVDEVQTLA